MVVAELGQEGLNFGNCMPFAANSHSQPKKKLALPEQHHELKLELVQQVALDKAFASLADDISGVDTVGKECSR